PGGRALKRNSPSSLDTAAKVAPVANSVAVKAALAITASAGSDTVPTRLLVPVWLKAIPAESRNVERQHEIERGMRPQPLSPILKCCLSLYTSYWLKSSPLWAGGFARDGVT